MDNARSLFNLVIKRDYSGIKALFENDGQEEHLFLDFKEKNDPNIPGAQGKDRENFSKTLSAFSNSSGGIIIWGIKCKKQKDAPDVASEEKPINYLKKFITDLNDYVHQAIIPLNTKIINKPIYLPGNKDRGFIVTYVPESGKPPHRAIDGLYYTRAGSSSVKMEHHLLADSFGKRQKPLMRISYRIESQGSILSHSEYRIPINIIIGIRNEGRFLATYPSLRVKCPKEFHLYQYGIDGNGNLNLRKVHQSQAGLSENGYLFTGGANDVIHPNTTIEVAAYSHIGKNDKLDPKIFKELNPTDTYCTFGYEIFAEGCESVSGNLKIKVLDILRGIKSNIPEGLDFEYGWIKRM